MTATPPNARRLITAGLAAFTLAFAGLVQGCTPSVPPGGSLTVREITPAVLLGIEARDPSLASDGQGTVALAWVSGDSSNTNCWLMVSRDSGSTFSLPARLNLVTGRVTASPRGGPALAIGAGGTLAVAWSEWRGDTSRAIDVRVRASADFGRTLGRVATVNDDVLGPPEGLTWRQLRDWPLTHRSNPVHHLPSLAFTGDGSLHAAWLDDRRLPEPVAARAATLWHSISRDGGQTWSLNVAVSDSASPLCRPALAVAPDGTVALAYRDAANDLREPRLALSSDGQTFTSDTLIARDAWRVAACPGETMALAWEPPGGGYAAWYTGAAPAGVYMVRWRRDGGLAGLKRPVADELPAATHPVITPLGDGMLVGVESAGGTAPPRHRFAVRVLAPSGTWSRWTILGANATSGALAATGRQQALACWIEQEPGHTRLRLALLSRTRGGRA